MMMTQCRLRNSAGATIDAWIESRGAIVGRWVDVKDLDDRYEVLEAHDSVPSEVVKDNERNWKSHRNATDI